MGLVSAAAVVVLVWTPLADADDIGDVWIFLRSAAGGIGSVRWPLIPVIVVLTVLHYLCAAVVLRAGAGGGLELREAVLVQFAAAAANRLTPPGIGGAAGNARYLVRRSRPAADAVGVVAAVNLLGALADAVLLVAVLAAAWVTGTGGPAFASAGSQAAHLTKFASSPPHAVFFGIAVSAAALSVTFCLLRYRRNRPRPHSRAGGPGVLARSIAAAIRIGHRPGDLATLLAASAGTTLVLAIAFVISVVAVPHGPSTDRLAVLLGAYLIGAAVGSAAPTPAGMGSTETALMAMLLAANVTAAPALQGVLLFRALTFWAPMPIGILAAAILRRRGAL